MKEYIIPDEFIDGLTKKFASAQGKLTELIRCKDCKHRPKRTGNDDQEGYNLEFPDSVCPCQCDDPWYNWMPYDNWYCGYGVRKEE